MDSCQSLLFPSPEIQARPASSPAFSLQRVPEKPCCHSRGCGDSQVLSTSPLSVRTVLMALASNPV